MPQASQPGSSSACCCNNPPNKPDTLEFRRACVWGPTGTDYAPPQTHENMPRSTPNWLGTVSQDHMMLQEAIGVQGGAPLGSSRGVTACPTDVTAALSRRCMPHLLCAVQAQQALHAASMLQACPHAQCSPCQPHSLGFLQLQISPHASP